MFHAPKRLTRVLSAMAIAVGLGAGAAGIAAASSGASSPAQQSNADVTPAGETVEAPGAPGEATAPEPANDPGPDHQDANGVDVNNVDQTPAGQAPEAEAPSATG